MAFASRFWRRAWTRSSSERAPRAWRIMLAAWALHFRASLVSAACLRARRRQSSGLGVGGDVLGGEGGLVGVGGEQGGDQGDGGVVAAGEVFRGVGDRRREGGAEGVDELVVHVAGEEEGEVGVGGVHGGSMALVLAYCQELVVMSVLVWGLSLRVGHCHGSGIRGERVERFERNASALPPDRLGRSGRGAILVALKGLVEDRRRFRLRRSTLVWRS